MEATRNEAKQVARGISLLLAMAAFVALPEVIGTVVFLGFALNIFLETPFGVSENPEASLRPMETLPRGQSVSDQFQVNDPRQALEGLALFCPPILYLIDVMALHLEVPVLTLVGSLGALALAFRTRDLRREERHRWVSARLVLISSHLFVWLQVLSWCSLGTKEPAWLIQPMAGGIDWWWFRGLLLPFLMGHLLLPERSVEDQLARFVHALLRVWHNFTLRLSQAGEKDLRLISGNSPGGRMEVGEEALGEAPRCPFCDDDLALLPAVRCLSCGTPHHRDCWETMEGCSTYACGGTRCESFRP